MIGSSPRAWGRLPMSPSAAFLRRFIPTCVGQTPAAGSGPVRRSVHPHVRGADDDGLVLVVGHGGSSPRAWGRRITALRKPAALTVHPHVRGADVAGETITPAVFGSSPRAWGRRSGRLAAGAAVRFIPTCVGQTQASVSRTPGLTGSSPRAWGRRFLGIHQFTAFGSSPRAWGRRVLVKTAADVKRFIPTCVGQTRPGRP